MPPLSIMIKPASGACNFRCKYCFYHDITQQREVPSYGMMDEQTLREVMQKVFAYAERQVFFVFQGGEPMLRGLEFFKEFVRLEQKYNKKHVAVTKCIQTNGSLLDEEWASFLTANRFLVGLSLDGPRYLHDRWRVDESGQGSFDRVFAAAKLLQKCKVDFNILSVVTAQSARKAKEIYAFFQKNGFLYQQYIPCLDPLGEARGKNYGSLTPELYAKFLINLFDLWYEDIQQERFVYIRYFENLAAMLQGRPPESCGMNGTCGKQYVIEADGSVYPCDFYVLDKYCLGNLRQDSFKDLDVRREQSGFLTDSVNRNPDCIACRWRSLCNGGCRRDREGRSGLEQNYFCRAYQTFFAHAVPKYYRLWAGR